MEKKYKIKYLPLFYNDLDQITDYIIYKLNNEIAANNFVDELENEINKRAYNPEANEKYIFDENELINLIKEGINPLEYIRNKDDINFISYAITKDTQSIDPFWDDMANTLLKAIINYLLASRIEDKSLKRCLEISKLGLNKAELSDLFYSLDDTETISLFKQIESAPDKTYKSIVNTLNEKLSKLIN